MGIKNIRQFEDRKGREKKKKREIKEQYSRCFESYFDTNMLSVVLVKFVKAVTSVSKVGYHRL